MPLDNIENTIRNGKPGTAMKSFEAQLSEQDITNVASFVYGAFIKNKQINTKYHTPENGWYDHERYRDAFPFAKGELSIDTPWEKLTSSQRKGRQLFMRACVTCHDRAVVEDEGAVWESRPLSYPRNQYSHRLEENDSVSSASPMAIHDLPTKPEPILNESEKQGRLLYLDNCAFCHGRDGKGKNWIGSFIEPHPRDLSGEKFLAQNDVSSLTEKIAEGVPGTAMPAWKTVLSDHQMQNIAQYILRKFIAE